MIDTNKQPQDLEDVEDNETNFLYYTPEFILDRKVVPATDLWHLGLLIY